MGVALCDTCPKCGSTAISLGAKMKGIEFPEAVPHKFVTKYDQNTGKPYQWCQQCYKSDKEIGRLEAPNG